MTALREAAAGIVATALSEVILTPLDAIKTLQQETAIPLNFMAATRQLFGRSGVLGMFSGGAEFIAFNAVGGGIKFSVYEPLCRLLASSIGTTGWRKLLAAYLAAALSFIASSLVMVPGELIKMRLQIGRYTSLGHALRSIYSTSGLGGFYTGYWAVCLRDIPYTMLELGLYETVQAAGRYLRGKEDLNALEKSTAATITGTVTGWLTNPLDLVKTRLMAAVAVGSVGEGGARGGLAGVADCFREAHAEGGLFKGAYARALWMTIAFPIYFGLYDMTMAWLARKKRQPKLTAAAASAVGKRKDEEEEEEDDIVAE